MVVPFDKPILCPILVGRAPFVETLHLRLEQARAGHGQTLLLAGEAGIGKSRLVAEAKTWAAQHQWLIQQGRCFEPDRVLPYAPLLDLLRAFLATHAAAALQPFAPELIKLLPELDTLWPGLKPSAPLEPEAEKRRQFQTLEKFLTQDVGPSLLIFEDLHWCDDTSLEFLSALTRQIANVSILLLLTYRNDEPHLALQHFLADLDRARLASELTLTRLPPADVSQMIRAIFEQPAPVQSEFVMALHTLTDGNPFFIEETLKALMTSGDIFYGTAGWTRKPMEALSIPRTVQDAVGRRTVRLSDAARQLLILAAVAGRRFDFELLQALTQRPEAELLTLVKELITAQLVIEESPDQFLFRHALTRQAIYTGLLARERRALHRQIAEVLASRTPTPLAELAHHTYDAGLWDKALDYARRAGEVAQRQLYTPRAALEHYTRALESARQLQAPTPLALLREHGQLHQTLGEFELARADYEALLLEARARTDAQHEWQALIDLGFLTIASDHATAGDYFRAALALAPTLADPATVAQALNRVGNWHLNLAQPTEALRYHAEAARIFETLDDKRGQAATHDLLGITYLVACDLVQCTAHYERAMALFRELNDLGGFASSLVIYATRGADYLGCVSAPVLTPLADRLRDSQLALDIAHDIEARPAETMGTTWLGLALTSAGEYGRGLTLLRQGLAMSGAIEHRHFMATAHMILGAFHLDILARPQACAHLTQALDLARETGSHVWLGISTALLADALDGTEAEALLHTRLTPALPMQTTAERHLWRAQAEWHLAHGQAREAFDIAQRLIQSVPDSSPHAPPRLNLLLGEAALAVRRYASARLALQHANDVAEALGLLPLCWRINIALGKLARAQGQAELGTAHFAEARTQLDALTANLASADPILADHFRQATATLTHARTKSTQNQFGTLTKRERDVAALIAQGKSNKDIADVLALSPRTVEAHIANILSKLGFTSRAQVAVWMVESGRGK